MSIRIGSGSLVRTALGFLIPLLFLCIGAYALYEGAMLYLAGLPIAAYGPWLGAGATFAVVSLGGVVAAVRRRRRAQQVQTLKTKHADALWRVRPAWRSPAIRETTDSGKSLIVFALLWNGVTWPMAGYILHAEFVAKAGAPQWGALFTLVFPLAGLALGWFAVKRLLHRRKYGTTTLQMDAMPARLGRRFEARVQTNIDAGDAPDKGFHVRLTCYHRYVRYTTDSDGDRKKKVIKDRKWGVEKHVRGRAYGTHNTLEVPVAFDLPPDAPPSTPEKSEERMMWEVDVDADVPGLDYDVSFEVPVFPPDEEEFGRERDRLPQEPSTEFADGASDAVAADPASDLASASDSASASAEAAGEAESDRYARYDVETTYDAPVSDGVTMAHPPGGGVRFDFAAGRNLKMGLLVGTFGVVFGGVGIAMIVGGMLLFGAVFAAVGGGLLYYGAWPALTHSSTVSIQAGTVSVRKGAFGGGATTTFPVTELVDVRVDENGHMGESPLYALTLYRDDAQADANAEATREKYERFVGFMRKSGFASATQRDAELDTVMARIEAHAGGIQVADGLTNKSEADWMASELVKAAERESAFA